jgi:DUF2892 family protein
MSTKNVGCRDARIRGLAAGLLLLISASLPERPLVAVGLGFIGVVIIGTALFRVCPLYTIFGFSTNSSTTPRPS